MTVKEKKRMTALELAGDLKFNRWLELCPTEWEELYDLDGWLCLRFATEEEEQANDS